MADRSRIGVITGLAAEAATLPEDDFWIAVSAANPAQAAQAADAMIAGGVTLLVSYGLAAGLDPRFGPGALLLPETVIAHEGEVETPDRGGVRDQLQRMTSFKRDEGRGPPEPPPAESYLGVDGARARAAEPGSRRAGRRRRHRRRRPPADVRRSEALSLRANPRRSRRYGEPRRRPRGVSGRRTVRGAPCRQRSEQPRAPASCPRRDYRGRPRRRHGNGRRAAATAVGMSRYADACARRGAGDAPATPRWSPGGVPSLESVTPLPRPGECRAASPARAGRICTRRAAPDSGRSRAPSAPLS